MVIQRGDVWWASLPKPIGSGPGFPRPVLVVQSDTFNQSRIQTVVVAVITGNLGLASAPGNVMLNGRAGGLNRDSVVNVSQVLTIDQALLTEHAGAVSLRKMEQVDRGLRLVMGL